MKTQQINKTMLPLKSAEDTTKPGYMRERMHAYRRELERLRELGKAKPANVSKITKKAEPNKS